MYARSAHRQPYAWFRSGAAAALVYLRPDTDANNSGWTNQAGGTTNLYQVVDETIASDADYVRSSQNPTVDIIRFRLSDPSGSFTEPFNVSYRYGNIGGGSCKITARLKQGSTVIKSWIHDEVTTTFQTVTQTLSSGEFASITNFNDLFVEFEAGRVGVTLNPADKNPAISLSNGNLTATGDSVGYASVRATASASSGRKYWEVHVDTLNAAQGSSGIGDTSALVSFPPGYDSHGVSWINFNGDIYCNGIVVANCAAWAQGDTLCFAVDLTANLLWVRVNGAVWNNNAINNPATGVGGVNISARAAGEFFPTITTGRLGTAGTNDVYTVNFGATPYAQTPPIGFGPFGGTVPLFNGVLLHLDGTNGSTSINDSSGNNHAFSLSGTAVLDTSQAKFGASSVSMGSGLINGDGSLSFGTGDYTVDFWFKENGVQGSQINILVFGNSPTNDTIVYIPASDTIRIYNRNSGTNVITGTTAPSPNVWHHVALTRASGVARLFLNGVQEGSNWSDTKNYTDASTEPMFGSGLVGWVDEIRHIKGLAMWTANFTPPTAPYY